MKTYLLLTQTRRKSNTMKNELLKVTDEKSLSFFVFHKDWNTLNVNPLSSKRFSFFIMVLGLLFMFYCLRCIVSSSLLLC